MNSSEADKEEGAFLAEEIAWKRPQARKEDLVAFQNPNECLLLDDEHFCGKSLFLWCCLLHLLNS